MILKTFSRSIQALTLAAVLWVGSALVAQQFGTPAPEEAAIAKQTTTMLERDHLSQRTVDDKVSTALVQRYVDELDPQKLYFLKGDVDGLSVYNTRLDDDLKAGKVDFAVTVFDLYLKRLRERIAVAQKLIDAEHDFTVDEEMPVDPKRTKYAETPEELNERWRKRIKYDLLLLKLEDVKPEEARDRLHRRYRNIQRTMEQTDRIDVLEIYLTALTSCFDPHSSYMSPRAERDFKIVMELALEGIGAALRSEDGYTIVASIVPGGAAAADGRLKVGDKILGVAQENADWVDVVEMKLTNVVNMIRGKAGTKVRLRVQPKDTTETAVYELTRQRIELKSSEVKGEIVDAGKRIPGATGRIGVIRIPSFYRDFEGAQSRVENFKSTARDTKAVLRSFAKNGGVDAVILDLRGNGGGALAEAIEVTGLFIPYGPVVQVKDQRGRINVLDDQDETTSWEGPLVVVCNRLSASASEIVAGAIKDYGRGVIVGDVSTHGKGTVQSVVNLSRMMFQLLNPPDRGALKLTINQFYRVNGDSTQNLGVPSDVVLPSLLDEMELGEQHLENALQFDKIRPAEFKPSRLVTPGIVSELNARSKARVAAHPEFARLQQDIEKYRERKNRKSVPLNEARLRAERNREEDKIKTEIEEEDSGDGPVFKQNFYNDELLQMTLDYLTLLKGNTTAKVSERAD